MGKLKGGSNLDYKSQLQLLLVVLIFLHSLLDVLIFTNQIQFVAADARNVMLIVLTIIVALLVVYLSYISLQNDY
jgi:hypothetical protein